MVLLFGVSFCYKQSPKSPLAPPWLERALGILDFGALRAMTRGHLDSLGFPMSKRKAPMAQNLVSLIPIWFMETPSHTVEDSLNLPFWL